MIALEPGTYLIAGRTMAVPAFESTHLRVSAKPVTTVITDEAAEHFHRAIAHLEVGDEITLDHEHRLVVTRL